MNAGPVDRLNLVVVHPHGRAGSLFLQSLFDGHPNVATLPHFGALYSQIPAVIDDAPDGLEAFAARWPQLFDTAQGYFGMGAHAVAGGFGEGFSEQLRVDMPAFKAAAFRLFAAIEGPLTRRRFFAVVQLAYAECVRGTVPALDFVVYHPHTYDELDLLLADFPDLRFIAMTRDPRQDWESWRRVVARRAGVGIRQLSPIFMLKHAARFSADVSSLRGVAARLGPDRLRILDLGALHRLNVAAMRRLCDWLGVPYDDCLAASTFNSRSWAGNAATREVLTTFSPSQARDRWREQLTAREIATLSVLLAGAIRWLRYEDRSASPTDVSPGPPNLRAAGAHILQQFRLDEQDRLGGRPLQGFSRTVARLRCAPTSARRAAGEVMRHWRGEYRDLYLQILQEQHGFVAPAPGPVFLDALQ